MKNKYIVWLESKIETCLEDKDLQREHWAFCQALRKFRELESEETTSEEKLFLETIEGGKWEGEFYLNNNGVRIILNPKYDKYRQQNDTIYVSNTLLWDNFVKHNLSPYDLCIFLLSMLSKHFKLDFKYIKAINLN